MRKALRDRCKELHKARVEGIKALEDRLKGLMYRSKALRCRRAAHAPHVAYIYHVCRYDEASSASW